MKRFLSLFLAIALIMTMVTGLSFAEEKRVLTFATNVNRAKELANDVFQEIGEKIGCEIKMYCYDSDSFAAMLTGNDLADVICYGNNIATILDSGLALNLDPYIDEYAPNLKLPQAAQCMELSRQLQSPDGGLYLLAPCIGMHNYTWGGKSVQYRGYVVRWDYYKELGCPEINNDDDYLNVLIQMLNNHPVNENGQPNLLFGGQDGFGEFNIGSVAAWSNGVDANVWCQYQYHNNIFTNEVVDGYLDTENSVFWNSMKFLNKIYRLGYFDEDCFTMTSDEFDAKVADGRYMGLVRRAGDLETAALAEDPDSIKGYIVVPSSNKNNYISIDMIMGNMPGNYSFIWKGSKNIDLAMKFFNYMYDPDYIRYIMCGEQGVHWDYNEDGVPVMFDEAIEARRAAEQYGYWGHGDDTNGGGGHGFRYSWIQGYNPAVLCSDGYPIDLTLTKENAAKLQSNVQKDFCKEYGVEYYQEAFVEVEKDFRNDLGECISACVTNVSTDDQRTLAACEDVLRAGIATMTMSETDEEYEANMADILAELESLGEAEVYQRYKVEWDKVKDVMWELHKESYANYGIELYPVD